jgi:peptidoglycan/LPS O-acetylase OafA/YrhL
MAVLPLSANLIACATEQRLAERRAARGARLKLDVRHRQMAKRTRLALITEALAAGVVMALVVSFIMPPGFWSSQHGALSLVAIIVLSAVAPFVRQGGPQTVRPWLRLLSGLVAFLGIAGAALITWLALQSSNQFGAFLTLGGVMLVVGVFFGYAAIRGRSIFDRAPNPGAQSDA